MIDRTTALSETSQTEFSAILCRKVRPNFGRTEPAINHYSNDIIYTYMHLFLLNTILRLKEEKICIFNKPDQIDCYLQLTTFFFLKCDPT